MSNIDITTNIALKYINMSKRPTSPKDITQKYIKMSNIDITKIHNTEIYKDEHYGHHQKT